METTCRLLRPGDEATLGLLAREDGGIDVEGRAGDHLPLERGEARDYLQDSGVLHRVASLGERLVGFLLCHVLAKRSRPARQFLLYEIGVHEATRRQEVGRALVQAMRNWMAEQGIQDIWVLADNREAAAFYRACGFAAAPEQPTLMTADCWGRRRSPAMAPVAGRDLAALAGWIATPMKSEGRRSADGVRHAPRKPGRGLRSSWMTRPWRL